MPNINDYFTFKIGGEAGFGVKSAGLNFTRVVTRSGYHIYTHTEYPSLIRGGHNVMQISISPEPVFAAVQTTDFLVALNQETVNLHKDELVDNSGLLFDPESNIDTKDVSSKVHLFPVPLSQIAKDAGGTDLMRNTVAIAASLAMLGGDLKHFMDLIAETFAHKKDEITTINQKAAQLGYDYAKKEYQEYLKDVIAPREGADQLMVINGNHGAALGAVAAGLQFAAVYPMTPTSNILHTLAPIQEEYKFIYKQPEDEISALNMALGAAHAGSRSMVATSGGGFCLMSETYGLAALTETPVVIIEGMRGAPATGIPTWNEQGDLRLVLNVHQGDIPRITLASGDAEETFHLTMKAFNLAEKYQTPVTLIIDKHICENDQSYKPFDYSSYKIDRGKFYDKKVEDFTRYDLAEDGISTRSIAGVGNHFIANSDEHDEHGYSNEEIDVRNAQMKKRMTKMVTCANQDMEAPQLYGPEDADVTLVSWGSNKGAIMEALKLLPNVNFLHITWLNPFPAEAVQAHLEKAKYLIDIECNYSAQLGDLIREKTGIKILDHLLKYDGRPIYPEEIIKKVKSVL